MRYFLVDDGIVIQSQPDTAPGFIEGPDYVVCGWNYDGETFSPPSAPPAEIETLRTAKIADLTAACQATILGGFTSGALGTPHQYPSQFTDQINLMGSVTESLLPDVPEGWVTPFWCADEGGVWLMRLHSTEQIRQAGRDGKAHVLACQQVLDALVLDAGAAETAQAIADIVWPGTA